jgi:hypothetical protein
MRIPKSCSDCPFAEDRGHGRNRLYCGHLDRMTYAHHAPSTDCEGAFNVLNKNNCKFMPKQKKNRSLFVPAVRPCPDGAWFVSSETSLNAYYRVKPQSGYCSCPAATKPCKHLAAVASRFRVDGTKIKLMPIDPVHFLYVVFLDGERVGKLARGHERGFVFARNGEVVAHEFNLCKLLSEIESDV